MKYIQPRVFSNSFTCPHCGAIAKQDWWSKRWFGDSTSNRDHNPIRVGTCHHCQKNTLWIEDKIYFEASAISSKSPRGAAALLRLSIQILCQELGEPGKNINTDVGNLVTKGLPVIVQQSLDIVRVTGNDAVHPGQIDTDNPETVGQLFDLVNIIIEYMIALPKKVSGIYGGLPSDKVKGINDRDRK